MTSDVIQLEGIERRKKIGSKFADGYSFPGANNKIREQHDPSGKVTDGWRKNLRSVSGFAGSVRQALHPLAVNVADRQQENSADCETYNGAERPAAAQPIVHDDQPTDAHHGSKGEREVISEAQFACE